jgi:2-polyprenyl-6-methoxyphenol hydroxylase-like FAD-dependent oxidoreductase
MWGISRAALDQILLDAARDAGAQILVPARCETLIPGARPRVSVRDFASNRVVEMEAAVALLADGKSALRDRRPAPTGDLGVKAHFTNVDAPRDTIELFGVSGHYVGVAPIEGERWNLAMSVPAAKVARFAGNLQAVFDSTLRENDALGRRFHRASRVSEWLASPLPRFAVAHQWQQNVIPLGNAAAALEPVGGEGMGLAMRSAELAAHELIAAANAKRAPDFAQLRREFTRLWRMRRFACRAAAVMISSGKFAHPAARLLDGSRPLQLLALAAIGKG